MRDRVEIREGTLTYRVQDTARSIERVLKMAEGGKLGCRVHLVFSIDAETFILGDPSPREVA